VLKVGQTIFIPCEVKPGSFSDERMIRVETSGDEWIGFVHVNALRDDVLEGKSSVVAMVVAVTGNSYTAQIPGHSVQSSVVKGSEDGLVSSGTV